MLAAAVEHEHPAPQIACSYVLVMLTENGALRHGSLTLELRRAFTCETAGAPKLRVLGK
jgi:hypothetical protein